MMFAASDGVGFWDLFLLFFIFLPLIFLWGFALFDIFRRDDTSGAMKVIWALIVLFLPIIGTLVYFLLRPGGATPSERAAADLPPPPTPPAPPLSRAEQLKTLSDLHDRGKLSDQEFAAEKASL